MRHQIEYIALRLARRATRNPTTGCLEWTKATRGGYGRLWDGQRLVDAHRLAWECERGAIPPTLKVLHHCDNPKCIDVAHLFCGTQADNMADRDAKGRQRNGSHKLIGVPSKVRGSAHKRAKLTEHQARAILRSAEPAAVLRRRYGVSDTLVRHIRAGRNWGWLRENV